MHTINMLGYVACSVPFIFCVFPRGLFTISSTEVFSLWYNSLRTYSIELFFISFSVLSAVISIGRFWRIIQFLRLSQMNGHPEGLFTFINFTLFQIFISYPCACKSRPPEQQTAGYRAFPLLRKAVCPLYSGFLRHSLSEWRNMPKRS